MNEHVLGAYKLSHTHYFIIDIHTDEFYLDNYAIDVTNLLKQGLCIGGINI